MRSRGHDKATGHVCRVALVPDESGDDVPGDPRLHRRNHYTSEVTKSITA